MVNVILHGALGKVIGRDSWCLNVASPAEALRAIEANTGKLFNYLRSKVGGFTEYRILIDDKDWSDVGELTLPIKPIKTIHFIPVPQGADSQGVFMTVIGVILMVLAVVFTYGAGSAAIAAEGGFLTALTSGFSGIVLTTGLALTIGGIASLLTPMTGTNLNEKPSNRPSYIFNGPINTYRQGNPVPIGFGTLLIGSQVISAGVRASDLPNITTWTDEVAYILGQQVQFRNRIYESKQDENLGHSPPTYPTAENIWWRDITNQ